MSLNRLLNALFVLAIVLSTFAATAYAAECKTDAKMCPDGSFVGRTGPNCEFAACPISTEPIIACTGEAKMCPDGSFVGRTGPNCEFAACPACKERPACLDATPSCKIPEPATGWCKANACPMDAKQCPDGTFVGRTGPNCEFVCTTGTTSPPGGVAPAQPPAEYACDMDAKQCPDGSYVGRSGPNCEFACPTGAQPQNGGVPAFGGGATAVDVQFTSAGTSVRAQPTQVTITKTEGGGVIMTSAGDVKYTGEVMVQGSNLVMKTSQGEVAVSTGPEAAVQATEAVTTAQASQIELTEKLGKPVYDITGTQQSRLFFIIPVSIEVVTRVDAQNGEVISFNKPWWSFLAWG